MSAVGDARKRLAESAAVESEDLRIEWLEFTTALGFGDGVTEPAATPRQIIEHVEWAFSEASEYREGPRICENCGEWLATATCEPCHGSGCGPGTASGAYDECEHCAGVGKVHPGCVGYSYADLAARIEQARAEGAAEVVARVEAVMADPKNCWWHTGGTPCIPSHPLRAALRGDA